MLPKAPTAASGVRKPGMPASFSSSRATPTDASPIQHDSNGLPIVCLTSTSAPAMAAASTPTLGE